MGKAAENESIKLRATFYNNIGVGLLLAGCLIPYLAIYYKLAELIELLNSFDLADKVGPIAVMKVFAALAAFISALYGSRYYRRLAQREIAKILD
jgi:hypothetical protein